MRKIIDYFKPHLAYEKQIELLTSRGLIIEDKEFALGLLRSIGYYRLSSYLYPFRDKDMKSESEKFKGKVSIEIVAELIEFDSKLRHEILAGLESFELSFKAILAYIIGICHPFIHYNFDFLHPKLDLTKYEKWKEKYERDKTYAQKQDYIKNYLSKYDDKFPIWIAVEFMQFGTLTFLFEILTDQHKKEISDHYSIPSNRLMNITIESFRDLRNICAHHSRLWNSKNINIIPKISKTPSIAKELIHIDVTEANSIYRPLVLLVYLVEKINPSSGYKTRIKNLIDSFPVAINDMVFNQMGFPIDWKSKEFWLS